MVVTPAATAVVVRVARGHAAPAPEDEPTAAAAHARVTVRGGEKARPALDHALAAVEGGAARAARRAGLRGEGALVDGSAAAVVGRAGVVEAVRLTNDNWTTRAASTAVPPATSSTSVRRRRSTPTCDAHADGVACTASSPISGISTCSACPTLQPGDDAADV